MASKLTLAKGDVLWSSKQVTFLFYSEKDWANLFSSHRTLEKAWFLLHKILITNTMSEKSHTQQPLFKDESLFLLLWRTTQFTVLLHWVFLARKRRDHLKLPLTHSAFKSKRYMYPINVSLHSSSSKSLLVTSHCENTLETILVILLYKQLFASTKNHGEL